MTVAVAQDEIRARGLSVQFDGCEFCKASKSMDDLHREHISRLNAEKLHEIANRELLAMRVDGLIQARSRYRLGLFAVSLVAVMALASNAGWFGR